MSKVMDLYNAIKEQPCSCGKVHHTSVDKIVIGAGAMRQVPDIVKEYGAKRPFLVADRNTWEAAGCELQHLLNLAGIEVVSFVFPMERIEPDEEGVGSAVMHYDHNCDMVIGVGSGVVNDISKILSGTAGVPYMIVGTAPSMDGFASATSSVARAGLKISLPSKCANVIVGDLDVLKNAPIRLLQAGLGDMLAKYVSICEWRIANELVDEPYCEKIAELVRASLQCCMDHADGLLKREEEAVQAVFEGLVVCGAAMEFAGLSRPASGVEHYFSHLWDMRGLEFGTHIDYHGIQCAVGTVMALRLYEQIRQSMPNKEKARAYAQTFDFEAWAQQLRELLGTGAETMIKAEQKEKKYDVKKHEERLARIIEKWDVLTAIMDEELPKAAEIEELLRKIGAPVMAGEMGMEEDLLPVCFKATKDIRDKYVLSRLAWDLGLLDEMAETL